MPVKEQGVAIGKSPLRNMIAGSEIPNHYGRAITALDIEPPQSPENGETSAPTNKDEQWAPFLGNLQDELCGMHRIVPLLPRTE